MFENIWTAIKTHPWVAGIGGAVILGGIAYLLIKGQSSSSSATPTQDLLVTPNSGPYPLIPDSSAGGGGGSVGTIPPIPSVPTTPTPPDTAPFTNGGISVPNPYVGPSTYIPPTISNPGPPAVSSSTIPYTSYSGSPANTLPAGSPTVTVPVGSTGNFAIIPYTGDVPSPAIASALGDTVAINAGLPASGQTAAQAYTAQQAAQQSVAAGAGSEAPSPSAGTAPDYAGAALIAAQQRQMTTGSTQIISSTPAKTTVAATSIVSGKPVTTVVSTAPAAGHLGITKAA